MHLSLPVGANSSNHPYLVSLCTLPHLFISYSSEQQINHLLQLWASTLGQQMQAGAVQLAIAHSKERLLPKRLQQYHYQLRHFFAVSYSAYNTADNRYVFLMQVWKELKKRKRLAQLHAAKFEKEPVMIVWLDDVFDLIITRKKHTGLAFLDLLLNGAGCKMHLVAASFSTYRNLLKQLAVLHPVVKEKLKTQPQPAAFYAATPLGAELVLTGDDLVYYKPANAQDYVRLYAASTAVPAMAVKHFTPQRAAAHQQFVKSPLFHFAAGGQLFG